MDDEKKNKKKSEKRFVHLIFAFNTKMLACSRIQTFQSGFPFSLGACSANPSSVPTQLLPQDRLTSHSPSICRTLAGVTNDVKVNRRKIEGGLKVVKTSLRELLEEDQEDEGDENVKREAQGIEGRGKREEKDGGGGAEGLVTQHSLSLSHSSRLSIPPTRLNTPSRSHSLSPHPHHNLLQS